MVNLLPTEQLLRSEDVTTATWGHGSKTGRIKGLCFGISILEFLKHSQGPAVLVSRSYHDFSIYQGTKTQLNELPEYSTLCQQCRHEHGKGMVETGNDHAGVSLLTRQVLLLVAVYPV